MATLRDWVITAFEPLDGLRLRLRFADGSRQDIDFAPVAGGWLSQLSNPSYFARVRLNDSGNLEWPDGEDFNPEALHDWPRFSQLYVADAQRTRRAA